MDTVSKLKRYMTPIPYTIEPGMSVRVALDLMRRHGIRHLPVEDGERIVGIISDWDILSSSSLEKALDESVASIMSRNPYRVTIETDFDVAVETMNREGLGSVLVVDGSDRVIGILTEKDVVRAFIESADPTPRAQVHALQ